MPLTYPLSLDEETTRRILSCALQEDLSQSDETSFNELSEVQGVLKEVMTCCLQNVIERFHTYKTKCEMLKKGERFDTNRVQRRLLRAENYLMEKFHEKKDMILYTKNASKQRYILAWRKCHTLIIRDLCSLDVVLDHLTEDDVLSEADRSTIIRKGTSRAKKEEFYRCIEGRTEDEFYQSVIPAIERENKHLADTILTAVDNVEERPEDYKCAVCSVNSDVQVKKLAAPLFQHDVINSALHADIRSSSLSNKQKWKELKDAGIPDENIIEALKPKYPRLYWDLERANKKKLDCFCGKDSDTGDSVSDIIYLRSPSLIFHDSFLTENPEDIANIDDLDDSSTTCTEISEYPMDAMPRGYCVIIYNTLLSAAGVSQARNTSVNSVEMLFKKLDFVVEKYANLTKGGLVERMRKFGEHTDHSHCSAFVCCLFCPGKNDAVFGCDERLVPLKDLTTFFAASRCPSLAGKPKLFFVDSSRGVKTMSGLKVPIGPMLAPSNTPKDHSKKEHNVIPDEADFCIAYATAPGFKSVTNLQTGSWFTQSLFEIIESQAERHDLLTCLAMVNEKVARLSSLTDSTQMVQVPTSISTLTKRVTLTKSPVC